MNHHITNSNFHHDHHEQQDNHNKNGKRLRIKSHEEGIVIYSIYI
jgi:hypothetical protein